MAILPISSKDAGRPSQSLIARLPRRYLILGAFIGACILLLTLRGPPPPPSEWSIPSSHFGAEHVYPPHKQWDMPSQKLDYDAEDSVDSASSTPAPSPLWATRAKQVKDAFIHAYSAYERSAFPQDELLPLTNSATNNFNAWGLTAIDALDTMMIMGLKKPVDRTLQHIAGLRVDDKSLYVPFFETTIRYLGGLLSAYAINGSSILLSRADDIGRALLPAFNTTLGLPAFAVDTYTGVHKDGWAGQAVILSEIGSASLEFRALAHYTGRAEYANAVDTVTRFLRGVKHEDGLFPLKYSRVSGTPMDEQASVGAMADSTYEYFLKGWLQTNRTEDHLRQLYVEAVDGVIDHLLYVSPKRGLLFVTDTTGPSRTITGIHEHLSCFLPGVLALGHATLPGGAPERHLWAAEGLAHTCWITYADSPTGLGPDEVLFRPPAGNSDERSKFDRGEWKWVHHLKKWEESGRHGRPPATGQAESTRNPNKREYEMVVGKEGYLLRPETIESLFILHRVTHDPKWRERGWQIFEALEKRTRLENGYASVIDVKVTRESEKEMSKLFKNEMPSWFLAETLKYFYLLFSEPEDIRDAKSEVIRLDQWVLNTEAHPLPIFEWAGWEARMFNITLT